MGLEQSMKGCGFAAEMLKALAHPLRLRIIAILCQKEATVSALVEELGVNQAVVSQQLKILRMRALVASKRENGYSQYRIVEPQLKTLIGCLQNCAIKHGHDDSET